MATDRGRYRFWHVPSGQTTFSIASEPLGHPLESLRGSLGFDLAEGTSFEGNAHRQHDEHQNRSGDAHQIKTGRGASIAAGPATRMWRQLPTSGVAIFTGPLKWLRRR
jgi:hypothetical protein